MWRVNRRCDDHRRPVNRCKWMHEQIIILMLGMIRWFGRMMSATLALESRTCQYDKSPSVNHLNQFVDGIQFHFDFELYIFLVSISLVVSFVSIYMYHAPLPIHSICNDATLLFYSIGDICWWWLVEYWCCSVTCLMINRRIRLLFWMISFSDCSMPSIAVPSANRFYSRR